MTTAVVYPIKGSAKTELTNVGEDQFQQHCVEATCDRVFDIQGDVTIGEGFKTMPKFVPMELKSDEKGEYWELEANHAYNFESNVTTKVAPGECFWLVHRSSFNRAGIRIFSALYDSGYEGGTNGVIYTSQNKLKLYKGTRIAQVLILTAETMKLYQGQWQGKSIAADGSYKVEEKK